MLGLLQLLALGLAIAIAIATLLVIRRLRRPPRRTYAWALARNLPSDPSELDDPRDFTPFEITACNHRLPAWSITGDDPAGPLVIATPGWGDSKIGILPRLPALLPKASRIIAWDPPGTGESTTTSGKPGLCYLGTREPRILIDIIDEHAEPHERVVLLGWSLGAGASIAAAALDAESESPRVAAVVAEAPYRRPWTPAFNVLRMARLPYRINGPIAFALLGLRLTRHPMWKGFDRARLAATVRVPLLLIHGTDDEICPFADSRDIAAATPNATLLPIPGAGHNNLWTEEPFASQAAAAVADLLDLAANPDKPRPNLPSPPSGVH